MKNTFSTFFKENPTKILGTLTEESGRFGPVQVVKGDFREIDRIDVSESLVPQIRSGSMAVDLNAISNIKASIKLQKSTTRSKKSLKALKQEKMNKTGNYILPVSPDSYTLFSNSEAFSFLNSNIDPKDVEVWVFYCLQTNRPIHPYLLENYAKYTPSYKLLMLLSDPANILPSKLSVIAEKADWLWENTTDENPNNSIILFALKHNKYFRKKFSDYHKLDLSEEQMLSEIDLLFEIITTIPSSVKSSLNLEMIQPLHNFYLNALLKQFIPHSQLDVMEKKHQKESREIAKLILGTPVIHEGNETFHLHYFSSSSDVFIKEVDYGTGMQDYGYSVINQDWEMSEYGYVSIAELLTIPDMNLDLHFAPKQLPEIRAFYNTDSSSRAAAHSEEPDQDKYAKAIEKLTKSALCQILIDFGNDIEIYDMSEVIDFDNHIYHIVFNLQRPELDLSVEHELQYQLDINESESYFVPLSGNVFTLPGSFNVGKFIKENMQQLDSRSQNTIYSFPKFLTDHSEALIGKKVAAKTFKRLEETEQKTLKAAYTEKSTVENPPKASNAIGGRRSKLKLTKFLKAHGVTQTMIDEINKTGEGQVIKKAQMPKSGSKHDKARSAMLPGKRLSSAGNIYYESRKDRADSGKNGL